VGFNTAVVIVAFGYALVYGMIESQRLAIAAPSLPFQVPASWVRREQGLTVQLLIWGVALGPGILTRNAYASMWLIPPVLALADSPAVGLVAGALAGAVHGVGRSTGVLRNMSFRGPEAHLAVLGQYAKFRSFDSVVLFLAAGIFASELVFGFYR
jgi:hypothetical protein